MFDLVADVEEYPQFIGWFVWSSTRFVVRPGHRRLLRVMLVLMHQIVDDWKWRRWATVFLWIGANAPTFYFLDDIINFRAAAARLVGGDLASLLDRVIAQGAGSFVCIKPSQQK